MRYNGLKDDTGRTDNSSIRPRSQYQIPLKAHYQTRFHK